MATVVFIHRLQPADGKRDALIGLLREFADSINADPECLHYSVHEPIDYEATPLTVIQAHTCRTASWWRRIKISAVFHASLRCDSRSHEPTRVMRRNTNRRNMTSDHHGRTLGEQLCWSEPWTGFSARTGRSRTMRARFSAAQASHRGGAQGAGSSAPTAFGVVDLSHRPELLSTATWKYR